jgi:hypothetical protein
MGVLPGFDHQTLPLKRTKWATELAGKINGYFLSTFMILLMNPLQEKLCWLTARVSGRWVG